MSPQNAVPEVTEVPVNAQAVAPEAEEPKLPPPPPFKVYNRSRADKLAKLLYGIHGRVWIKRPVEFVNDAPPMTPKPGAPLGVQIGTEKGSTKECLAVGKDFTAAFRTPVETYLKGASSYDDTKKRLREVSRFADVSEFVHPSLGQFDEYKAEMNRAVEKFKALLEKGRKQAEARK